MEEWQKRELIEATSTDPTYEEDPDGWLEEYFCGHIPVDAFELLRLEVPADALMY